MNKEGKFSTARIMYADCKWTHLDLYLYLFGDDLFASALIQTWFEYFRILSIVWTSHSKVLIVIPWDLLNNN